MVWIVEEAAETTATVEWLRREGSAGRGCTDATINLRRQPIVTRPDSNTGEWDGEGEADRTVWFGVRWIQKNGAHWLMYEETSTATDPDAAALQTVLVLRPHQLTWIRRGSVEWRHQFEAEQDFESLMKTATAAVSVSTRTHGLDISADHQEGQIQLCYTMDLSGLKQEVDMTIRFHRED